MHKQYSSPISPRSTTLPKPFKHTHSSSLGNMVYGDLHMSDAKSGPPDASTSRIPDAGSPLPAGHVEQSLGSPVLSDLTPGPREGQTRRGVCKFFNSQKGFGFVLDHNAEELGGQEVFVHFTAIQSKTGFRSLAEGEEVEYEITTGAKGFQASRLTGPGGRPVVGDPKARLLKQQPHFMQFHPFAFPGAYGMDPYAQQHPGALYAASPYNVVYVPAMQNGQPAHLGQFMPGMPHFATPPTMLPQQNFSPSNSNPAQAARNSAAASLTNGNAASPGASANSAPSAAPAHSAIFGPVGGITGQSATSFPSQSTFGSPFNPQSQPLANQRFSNFSPAGLGLSDARSTIGVSSSQQAEAYDGSILNGAPHDFFNSGNLLYSSQ